MTRDVIYEEKVIYERDGRRRTKIACGPCRSFSHVIYEEKGHP